MKHTVSDQVWVPVMGSSTAMLDLDTALVCSLIAWLLAKLQFRFKESKMGL
ncbi:MAG: hypothetical protein JXA33_13925 [Anaerolineae bacterium]|nr:hypothetical protein [Anaerolineae bacterium]